MTKHKSSHLRVLVTGSRDWPNDDSIEGVLKGLLTELVLSNEFDTGITLVHGGCPTGADKIAHDYFAGLSDMLPTLYMIEVHRADWKAHGKRAGFIRNKEMVDMGANLCVAFIKDQSRGASMTLDLAQKAGIPCVVVRNQPDGTYGVERPPAN